MGTQKKQILLSLVTGGIGLGAGLAIAAFNQPSRLEGKGRELQTPTSAAVGAVAERRVWLSRWIDREKNGQSTTIEMSEATDWTLENAEKRELFRTAHRDLDAAVKLIEETAGDSSTVSKTIEESIFKPLCQADPSAALAFSAEHPWWRDSRDHR